MFEKVKDVPLPQGTISPWPSNLAVCWLDTRNITYVAIIQCNNVHIGNWDNKSNTDVIWDTIAPSEPNPNDKTMEVTTVGLVHPNARNFPIAVIGTTKFIYIYDVKKANQKPLFSLPLSSTLKDFLPCVGKDVGPYCRGVSCNDNTILVGSHSGEIVVIMCNGDSNFSTKKNLKVNAHSRPVNSVSVAPESAYVLTSSEDGTFLVSKLHTRKPHAYQVEHRFSDFQSTTSIVGAQFTNGRGSAIAVASYDNSSLIMFKIIKKSITSTQ
uniref:WD_REPEATS_REGION domain-containing protein n=1 Tax=Caenorhabditis japonica TaxID=281687 RepID=A0A8R1HWV5_CAEJA